MANAAQMSVLDTLRQKILTDPNKPVDTNVAGMQYDPEYDEGARGLQTRLAGLQFGTTQKKQRLGEDVAEQGRGLVETRDVALKRLQERLANQGIGWSGINVEKQGEIGKEYLKSVGALKTQETRGLEDIETELTTGKADIATEMGKLNVSRARKESDRLDTQAKAQADAEANKALADGVRAQLDEIRDNLMSQLQPKPTPTGQIKPAPPPPQPKPQAMPRIALPPPPPSPTEQIPAPDVQGNVDIRQLQTLLKEKGFDPGPIDGRIGPKTMKALAGWKTSAKMPVDGRIDPGMLMVLQFWNPQGSSPAQNPNLAQPMGTFSSNLVPRW